MGHSGPRIRCRHVARPAARHRALLSPRRCRWRRLRANPVPALRLRLRDRQHVRTGRCRAGGRRGFVSRRDGAEWAPSSQVLAQPAATEYRYVSFSDKGLVLNRTKGLGDTERDGVANGKGEWGHSVVPRRRDTIAARIAASFRVRSSRLTPSQAYPQYGLGTIGTCALCWAAIVPEGPQKPRPSNLPAAVPSYARTRREGHVWPHGNVEHGYCDLINLHGKFRRSLLYLSLP